MHRFRLRVVLASWVRGWAAVGQHGDLPGYRELPAGRRLVLDLRFVAGLPRAWWAWRTAACVLATLLAVQTCVWRLDLAGWQRDLPGLAPGLLVLPWLARARRRHHLGAWRAGGAAAAGGMLAQRATLRPRSQTGSRAGPQITVEAGAGRGSGDVHE